MPSVLLGTPHLPLHGLGARRRCAGTCVRDVLETWDVTPQLAQSAAGAVVEKIGYYFLKPES